MTWLGVRPFPDVDGREPIFGFTFRQPFATAVMDGPKRIENRPKEPYARLQGRAFWIAIHAGIGWYDGVQYADMLELWPDCPPFEEMPSRVLLGAARVVGWSTHETPAAAQRAHGRWAFGPVCWELDPTVVVLPRPLPHPKGALGLWTLPTPALQELRKAKADPGCWRRAA